MKIDVRLLALMVVMSGLLLSLTGCGLPERLGLAPPPEEISKGADLLVNNDEAGAVAQFNLAIQKHTGDPSIYLTIGRVCGSLKRWKLVAKYAEEGIAATRKQPAEGQIMLYIQAASAYQYQGMNDKAVALNEEAFKIAPNDPTVLNNLGYSYAEAAKENDPKEVGRLDQALKLTTRAVTLARDTGKEPVYIGTFLDSVGWVQFKQGNYDDAVKNLTRAISLAPDEAEVHYHLARAYQRKARYTEAANELQRALRLDPHLEPATSTLRDIQPLLPPGTSTEGNEPRPSSSPGPPGLPSSSTIPGLPEQKRR